MVKVSVLALKGVNGFRVSWFILWIKSICIKYSATAITLFVSYNFIDAMKRTVNFDISDYKLDNFSVQLIVNSVRFSNGSAMY